MDPKSIIVLYKNNQLCERRWGQGKGIKSIVDRLNFEIDSIKHVLLPPHFYFLVDLVNADDGVWILLSDPKENIFPIMKYYNGYLFYPSNRALSMGYPDNVYFGNISFVLSKFFLEAGPNPPDYNNLERFSELKNNKNIYFYGRAGYGPRKEIIDSLTEKGYNVVHDKIDFRTTNIMDRMVATNCFCSLSMDGGSWSCFRDFELAYYCIPTIKISKGHGKCDLSYNDGFYTANIDDSKDIENAIEKCRSNVSSGDSGKVSKAKKYANGLHKLLYAQKLAKLPFLYAIEAVVRNHTTLKKLILNENLPSDPEDLAIFSLNLNNWAGSKTKPFTQDVLSEEDLSKINSVKKGNEIILSYAGLYYPGKRVPPREAGIRWHYLVQAVNWVCALERLGVSNYMVICLDKDTFEKLSKFTKNVILGNSLFVDQKRWLWRKRMQAVNQLVKSGFDVILSDLDAVWREDPYKELFSRSEDIVCQNIALDPEDQPKRVKVLLKNGLASMICPGILRIRNNERTKSFWENKVLGIRMPDDQDALNKAVLDGNSTELFNNQDGVAWSLDGIELFAANLENSKFGIRHARFYPDEIVSQSKRFSDLASAPCCFLTEKAYGLLKEILESGAKAIEYQGVKLQDKWVVEELFYGLRNGFYVDVGANHPVTRNNTYVLDKVFGWAGISIDAGPQHKDKFPALRTCPLVELKPKTRVLADVFREFKVPRLIHYMNIDVEHAEYAVLKNFPFGEFKVIAITLEHNNDAVLKKNLEGLLERNGYVRVKSWGNSDDGFVLRGFRSLKKSELLQELRTGKVGKRGEFILVEAELLSGLAEKSVSAIDSLAQGLEDRILERDMSIDKLEKDILRKTNGISTLKKDILRKTKAISDLQKDILKLKQTGLKKGKEISRLKAALAERRDMVRRKDEYIAKQKRVIASRDRKLEGLCNSKSYRLGYALLHQTKSLRNRVRKLKVRAVDEGE